jgi:outer membrane receptor protein involved in Fe transport
MLITRILSLILLLFNPMACWAIDDIYSLNLEALLKIKTRVASNVEDNWRKQPASVSVITRDKIALSNARTLSELLNTYVPGYFLVEDQDDTIAGFRGLVADNNSKVMLLLNGVNLNTEWFWGPPDAILNGLDLNYIERVEVTRSPGSVTLGQGALLGVINIVTRQYQQDRAAVSISYGDDGLRTQHLIGHWQYDSIQTNLYLGTGRFDSQALDNSGWAALRLDQGLTVYQRQHHLRRGQYNNYLLDINGQGWGVSGFHFEQKRDLYNFFRDREVVEQRLDGLNFNYQEIMSTNISVQLSGKYIRDDYALYSHGSNIPVPSRLTYEAIDSGFAPFVSSFPELVDNQVAANTVMGGTREERSGIAFKLNWDELIRDNRLVLGAEVNYFKSGQKNHRGDNFIINEQIQSLGLFSDGNDGFIASGDPNMTNAYVKPGQFNIKSFFVEDFYQVNDQLEIFAAFRWDSHPNWGEKITPRFGLLYDIDSAHLFRLSWQSGFRGAVGVQFSGGFVQDGFLAEDNFSAINAVAETLVDFDFDGIASNDSAVLLPVKPESIKSLELAYQFNLQNLRVNSVLFFNNVEDILIAKAHGYQGLEFGDAIGSDTVGTWNGSWYYQNQNGTLEQNGLELEIAYESDPWYLEISHSAVSISKADQGTIGNYVLEGKKIAAYPDQVTRLHLRYHYPADYGQWTFALHDLWYQDYYAPTGIIMAGANIVDLASKLRLTRIPQMELGFHLKNVTDANELYPINGTGNLSGAVGSPAIEGRSWWLNLSYEF